MNKDAKFETRTVHAGETHCNPTQTDFERKMANLEGGEAAVATASGMAAISGIVLALLKAGDHIIASDTLYGCTHALFSEMLPDWNIEVSFVDMTDPANIEVAVQDNTKVIYGETPANPTMSLIDLEAMAEIGNEIDKKEATAKAKEVAPDLKIC